MNKGFDANRDLSPFATCLKATGYGFVGRYYNINNPGKNLTYAEANFLSALGIKIIAVWENGFPTSSAYFSYKKGFADGAAAYEYASSVIHQPALTPIYFAVDYDASISDTNKEIIAYFTGIGDAFNQISPGNSGYLIGVYGSGLVCKTLLAAQKVTYCWLAQSKGWSGYNTFKVYNIRQLAEKTECISSGGLAGDPNESPNNNEGSFQITHLTDVLMLERATKEVNTPQVARLTFAQVRSKVIANNKSPFTTELVIAICWAESSFDPSATATGSSSKGLMMMNKGAVDTVNHNTPASIHFEPDDMLDADKAIACGTWYLKILYTKPDWNCMGNKKETLRVFRGVNDYTYVNKIIKAEECLKSTGSSDPQICLNQIHTLSMPL